MRQIGRRSPFVGVTKDEFARLKRRAGAGCRDLATAFYDRLRESIEADTIVSLRADGDLTKLKRSLARRKVVTEVVQLDGELRVHVRGAAEAVPIVLSTVDKSGSRLTDLSVSEPTLETVFINLTGKDLRD